MNHEPDPVAEMYALLEQYNKFRSIGSKKMKNQAKQIQNTLLECFSKQTEEVREAFFEKIGMSAPVESHRDTDEFYANAPDYIWLGDYAEPQKTPTTDDCQTLNTECAGTRYYVDDGAKSGFIEVTYVENEPSESTLQIESSELALQIPSLLATEHYSHFILKFLPEQICRYKADDARAIRWFGLMWSLLSWLKKFPHRKNICEELDLPWQETTSRFFYEKSYAIQKDPTTLRLIIREYMHCMNWYFYSRYNVPQSTPEFMHKTVIKARDYWNQLEPSTLKDKWNEMLLEYERIAKCWDDYCTHKSLYADFQQYMAIRQVE